MNIPLVLNILGALLIFLAGALLFPAGFSIWYQDGVLPALLEAAMISLACGALLMYLTRGSRNKRDPAIRDGFAIVTFGWLVFALFGAIPFTLSGAVPSYLDAVFETMSGFTTTGATILMDVEALPESLLFWRAATHWLGGMGIIVLSLAILPMLGVGGMQLFKAEVPGPTADRLKPRIRDTAKLLWGVYVLLTVLETALLMGGGMDFFDALCHSFATMATGGFSTKNASLAAYNSAYLDGIVTLFMFLAGINFSLHYHALRGRLENFWRNEEFLFYLGLTGGTILLLVIINQGSIYASLFDNLRYSAFQAVSILTTTGFGTADYEGWPVLAQYLLVCLMFIGGCAGSTGGGMKVARILLLFKHARVQLSRLIHPRAVILVKLGRIPVERDVMGAILGFFALFMGVFVVASCLLAATGVDLITSGAAVIATLSNIGPGLGNVGPTDNYAQLPQIAKGILVICMLMGRLELYTVLVLLLPSFWRK